MCYNAKLAPWPTSRWRKILHLGKIKYVDTSSESRGTQTESIFGWAASQSQNKLNTTRRTTQWIWIIAQWTAWTNKAEEEVNKRWTSRVEHCIMRADDFASWERVVLCPYGGQDKLKSEIRFVTRHAKESLPSILWRRKIILASTAAARVFHIWWWWWCWRNSRRLWTVWNKFTTSLIAPSEWVLRPHRILRQTRSDTTSVTLDGAAADQEPHFGGQILDMAQVAKVQSLVTTMSENVTIHFLTSPVEISSKIWEDTSFWDSDYCVGPCGNRNRCMYGFT